MPRAYPSYGVKEPQLSAGGSNRIKLVFTNTTLLLLLLLLLLRCGASTKIAGITCEVNVPGWPIHALASYMCRFHTAHDAEYIGSPVSV